MRHFTSIRYIGQCRLAVFAKLKRDGWYFARTSRYRELDVIRAANIKAE